MDRFSEMMSVAVREDPDGAFELAVEPGAIQPRGTLKARHIFVQAAGHAMYEGDWVAQMARDVGFASGDEIRKYVSGEFTPSFRFCLRVRDLLIKRRSPR